MIYTELRSCVKLKVAVLGSLSLIKAVKQHWNKQKMIYEQYYGFEISFSEGKFMVGPYFFLSFAKDICFVSPVET